MRMRPCPICHSVCFNSLVDFGQQPLSGHLLSSLEQKEILHEGRYVYCRRCHFVQIARPVPLRFQYDSYEYFSSGLFPPYVKKLAKEVYDFVSENKDEWVVEIGSNDGGFLRLLKEMGHERVLGVDASQPLVSHANTHRIKTLHQYFTPHTATAIFKQYGPPRVIVARFLLEHVLDLDDFMASLKLLSGPKTAIFLEIPDLDYILKHGVFTGFWDQHVNYFNLYTLQRLVQHHGFDLMKYSYAMNKSEQVIHAWLKATSGAPGLKGHPTPKKLLEDFSPKVTKTLEKIKSLVQRLSQQDHTIAVYGASHYPTNVVNYSGIGSCLRYALDQDVSKIGKYLSGSKLEVKASHFLEEDCPDYCLIAAVGNEEKIIAQHPGYLRKGGKFISLLKSSVIDVFIS